MILALSAAVLSFLARRHVTPNAWAGNGADAPTR
jgi:hypothetical protein